MKGAILVPEMSTDRKEEGATVTILYFSGILILLPLLDADACFLLPLVVTDALVILLANVIFPLSSCVLFHFLNMDKDGCLS